MCNFPRCWWVFVLYVCVYVNVCVQMCMCSLSAGCVHVCMCACVRVCVWMYVYMIATLEQDDGRFCLMLMGVSSICMYAHMCVYVCIHMCVYILFASYACMLYVWMYNVGASSSTSQVNPLGGPETLLVNLVPEVDRSVPPTAEVLKLQNYCDRTFNSWSLWMPFF